MCDCYAGYTGTNCNITTTKANDNGLIGVNLGGLAYW